MSGQPNKPAKAGAKPAAKAPPKARLAVTVDGKALGDDEARAGWEAFSAWMDEHQGDTAGFAKQRGWASVAPTYQRGQAVLVVRSR